MEGQGKRILKLGRAAEPKSFGNRHELSFELCQNRSTQSRLAQNFTASILPQIRMRLRRVEGPAPYPVITPAAGAERKADKNTSVNLIVKVLDFGWPGGPAYDLGPQGLGRSACLAFGTRPAAHVDCDRVGRDEFGYTGDRVAALFVCLRRGVDCRPEEDCSPGDDCPLS